MLKRYIVSMGYCYGKSIFIHYHCQTVGNNMKCIDNVIGVYGDTNAHIGTVLASTLLTHNNPLHILYKYAGNTYFPTECTVCTPHIKGMYEIPVSLTLNHASSSVLPSLVRALIYWAITAADAHPLSTYPSMHLV
jgi:hypothetical protein